MITASTLNDIITHINQDTDMYKEIVMNVSKQYYEDMWGEMMLILLEYKNPDKLIEAYNKKYFKYFFIRILTNQIHSSTSPFFYKYKRHNLDLNVEIESVGDIEDDSWVEEINKFNEKTDEFLEQEHWYDKELFNMYYKEGLSYSKINQLTKIPKSSLWNSVSKTTERFRNYLNKNP